MGVYIKHTKKSAIPQTEKASKGQKKNDAGGYSFKLDCWNNLDRFLILGCEGGSYYVDEKKATKRNVKWFEKCLDKDYVRAIDQIAEISKSGRAIKNDPAIFLLGLASSNKNQEISRYALSKLNDVCRIGTHLFQFVEVVNEMRGWGRALREAVQNWYLSKDLKTLAYQVSKYKQRNGWGQGDVIRLAHPKPENEEQSEIFRYAVSGKLFSAADYKLEKVKLAKVNDEKPIRGLRANAVIVDEYQEYVPLNTYLAATEELKSANEKRQIQLITDHNMPWEVLPTESLNSVKIWEALLQNMPLTAMIRNLGKMSSIGLLKPLSNAEQKVVEMLQNRDALRKARVHPFSLLLAYKNYAAGHGFRGSLTWSVNQNIVAALEAAYYLAFQTTEPTKKKFLFGLDVSSSMTSRINNTNITSCEVSACLAMTSMRIEPLTYVFGFSNRFVDLEISKMDSLAEACRKAHMRNFGTTDCAVPMIHALNEKLDVDVFVVITDNDTYAGRVHPHIALEQYRQKMGKRAKLIVVGTDSNGFTIADPNDPDQLDIVGFDANCPQIISEIAKQ